jgi:hypothetical protein
MTWRAGDAAASPMVGPWRPRCDLLEFGAPLADLCWDALVRLLCLVGVWPRPQGGSCGVAGWQPGSGVDMFQQSIGGLLVENIAAICATPMRDMGHWGLEARPLNLVVLGSSPTVGASWDSCMGNLGGGSSVVLVASYAHSVTSV